MQAYLITAKAVKQSIANAKTYLAEKNIKVPSSVLCELMAKILYRKTYNELVADAQKAFDTPLNLSEVFVQFGSNVSLTKLRELCQIIADKADFELSAIQEFQELQANSFKITIDNKKASRNILTFLMLFQQTCVEKGLMVDKLYRSSIRIETENLLMPSSSLLPANKPLLPSNLTQKLGIEPNTDSLVYSLEDPPEYRVREAMQLALPTLILGTTKTGTAQLKDTPLDRHEAQVGTTRQANLATPRAYALEVPVEHYIETVPDEAAVRAVNELANSILKRFKSHFNPRYSGPVTQINFANYSEEGCFDLWGSLKGAQVLCLFFDMLTNKVPETEYSRNLTEEGRPVFDKKDLKFLEGLRSEFGTALSNNIGQAVKKAITKKCQRAGITREASELCPIWTKEQGWLI